jgi:hypothetical protein
VSATPVWVWSVEMYSYESIVSYALAILFNWKVQVFNTMDAVLICFRGDLERLSQYVLKEI